MPLDITKLREEFGRLHGEANTLVELADTEKRDLTADEKTANQTRFGRMDQIKTVVEQHEKLAGYAFSRKDPSIKLETHLPGKAEADLADQVKRFASAKLNDADREEFAREFNAWTRTGNVSEKFASITTASQSGALLPKGVAAPMVPTAINSFRAAHALYGMQPLSTATTATLSLPVLDASAGGIVAETASSETEQPPSLSETITLAPQTFQSGSTWFSNQQLQAVDFDLFAATLPALQYSKELGLESAIAAAIIADAGITQTVATSTVSAFTYGNLVSLNRKLPKRFDMMKVMVLSQAAYTAAEGLTDSQGRPIFTPDAQNQELKRFNGTPVLRSDYFQAFGANHVIGVLVSLLGFRLRDCDGAQVARYTQFPARPNQTGYNLFSYHAWGYAPQAMATFVCPAS